MCLQKHGFSVTRIPLYVASQNGDRDIACYKKIKKCFVRFLRRGRLHQDVHARSPHHYVHPGGRGELRGRAHRAASGETQTGVGVSFLLSGAWSQTLCYSVCPWPSVSPPCLSVRLWARRQMSKAKRWRPLWVFTFDLSSCFHVADDGKVNTVVVP
jgi:hypothetical protein